MGDSHTYNSRSPVKRTDRRNDRRHGTHNEKKHPRNKGLSKTKKGYRDREPSFDKTGNMVYLNSKPKQLDYSLLITIFLLVMIGLVMVFSSSYYAALTKYTDQDPLRFIKLQARSAAIGVVAMMFLSQFDYRKIRKYTGILYVISIVLLILVLFVGEERGGAKRWLDLGFIDFQPSEVAKITTLMFLAAFIEKRRDILKTFGGFLKCMFVIILPVFLITIENLSTALVLAIVGTAMVFIASPVIWYFIAMAVPAVGAIVLAVTLPAFRYRLTRISTWYDPFADTTGAGFQTVQSLFAVASGGFFGLGLGQSRQKLGYIPEAYNDIIFSIICEELGLFGATAIILLFYVLIYKGIKIAMNCKDLFGTLVASGITCMIAIQVIINVAVNTNAMPVTGMPLPFVSYGGSSLLIIMCCMGVLLNISRYTKE